MKIILISIHSDIISKSNIKSNVDFDRKSFKYFDWLLIYHSSHIWLNHHHFLDAGVGELKTFFFFFFIFAWKMILKSKRTFYQFHLAVDICNLKCMFAFHFPSSNAQYFCCYDWRWFNGKYFYIYISHCIRWRHSSNMCNHFNI